MTVTLPLAIQEPLHDRYMTVTLPQAIKELRERQHSVQENREPNMKQAAIARSRVEPWQA